MTLKEFDQEVFARLFAYAFTSWTANGMHIALMDNRFLVAYCPVRKWLMSYNTDKPEWVGVNRDQLPSL